VKTLRVKGISMQVWDSREFSSSDFPIL